jgi:hypothetical protein
MVCSVPKETKQWQCSWWPLTKSINIPFCSPFCFMCFHIASLISFADRYGTLFFVLRYKWHVIQFLLCIKWLKPTDFFIQFDFFYLTG